MRLSGYRLPGDGCRLQVAGSELRTTSCAVAADGFLGRRSPVSQRLTATRGAKAAKNVQTRGTGYHLVSQARRYCAPAGLVSV
jgi:hypothetical protein